MSKQRAKLFVELVEADNGWVAKGYANDDFDDETILVANSLEDGVKKACALIRTFANDIIGRQPNA